MSSGLDVVLTILPFLEPFRATLDEYLVYKFDATRLGDATGCIPLLFQFHGQNDCTVHPDLGMKVTEAIAAHRNGTIAVTVPNAGHETAFDNPGLQAKLQLFLKPAAVRAAE